MSGHPFRPLFVEVCIDAELERERRRGWRFRDRVRAILLRRDLDAHAVEYLLELELAYMQLSCM